MNHNVTLGGHTAAWRFRDSDRLDEWLSARPWWRDGGVRVASIPAADLEGGMRLSLGQAVRAADHLGDLRVATLDPPPTPGGLRWDIGQSLEVDPGLPTREFARRVGIELRRPVLFVVGIPSAGGSGWWDEATALREDVARSADGEPPPLAVVLLAAADRPTAGEGFDLTTGGPSDGFLTKASAADPWLWRSYLHHRLAWEAAGDPVRAARADELGLADLPFGDDAAVERLLNEAAAEWFATLPEEIAVLAREYLGSGGGASRDRAWQVRAVARLAEAGVVWKPPASGAVRPSPWAARAALIRGEAGTARTLLRGCLSCPTVAQALLSRCFELEAQERTHTVPQGPPSPASDGEIRAWDRATREYREFCAGQGDHAAFYPAGSPATPSDPWDLLSFGDYFRLLPRDMTRHGPRRSVKVVRDALSHGHYPCWRMARVLLRAQRQLGW